MSIKSENIALAQSMNETAATTILPKEIKQRELFKVDVGSEYPPTDPAIRPPCSAFDVAVDLVVDLGDAIIHYSIHKGLLEFFSPYFKAAFSDEWRTERPYTATVQDQEEATLDCFMCWLYTGTVNMTTGKDHGYMDVSLLIKLWIFGDMYILPALQNACADEIRWQSKNFPFSPYDHLALLLEGTDSGSKLQSLMLDCAVLRFDTHKPPQLDESASNFHIRILQMVIDMEEQEENEVRARFDASCSYHVGHATDRLCVPKKPCKTQY